MEKRVPWEAAFGVIVAIMVVGVGFEVYSSMGNGETRNPNAGKPSKSVFRGLSRQFGDNMKEDDYLQFLKQNRPELSDAERQSMADRWWKIRSGK